MPEMSSLEYISTLRKDFDYKGPIITLIGFTDDHVRDLCYKTEINHLVTKPFDIELIKAYVEKYK